VADLIKHRMQHERIVHRESQGEIEIAGLGTWSIRLYRGLTTDGLHLALWQGTLDRQPTAVRVQGAPPAWTFLDPARSMLAGPARSALERIHAEGRGALVLMHIGGRSAEMLIRGFERDFAGSKDTASQPRAEALRDLGSGCQILRDLGLEQLRILSNSQRPIAGIEAYGLKVVETVPLPG